jgi:hypothetical protein
MPVKLDIRRILEDRQHEKCGVCVCVEGMGGGVVQVPLDANLSNTQIHLVKFLNVAFC